MPGPPSPPPRPGPSGGAAPGALGRRGEDLACAHLRACGLQILERNFRRPPGEIDVVARDGRTVVFVEVKTAVLSAHAGGPASALERISPRQRSRLRRCAAAWLAERRPPGRPDVRFDAVGVLLDARGGLLALDHLRGAW